MPHQREVVDVAMELDESGLFCYREVVVTMMRQNGKTQIVFPVEVDRGIAWDEPQRVIYTAQTGVDARKKLLEDEVPLLKRSPLWGMVRRVYQAAGQEAIVWRDGGRLSLTASARESGHGFTLDLGVLDECWNDEDDRREQAMVPAMNTRPMAQLWLTSTMGTERSLYLNRKVRMGRDAVMKNTGHGIAYFEWSIPEDADIENPDVWWDSMPALGWTIGENAIAHAFQTMEEAEWRRAYGNQMTLGEHDRLIAPSTWEAACRGSVEVDRTGPVVFGVDVLPERNFGAIVASDGKVCELIDHQPGTGWLLDRAKDLAAAYKARFVFDGNGPAASVAADFERARLKVVKLPTADVVAACAGFFDALADQRVRIRQDPAFDAAVGGLERKPMGDRFIWSRATSRADISPFMAATLAYKEGRIERPKVTFISLE